MSVGESRMLYRRRPPDDTSRVCNTPRKQSRLLPRFWPLGLLFICLALLSGGLAIPPAKAQLPAQVPPRATPPSNMAAGPMLMGTPGTPQPAAAKPGAGRPAQGTATPTPGPCVPGWSYDTPLPGPRQGAAVAVLGGYLYEASGFTGSINITATARYNGSGSWEPIAPIPTGVEDGAGVTDGTKFYVVAGYLPGSVGAALQIYDPAGNSWSQGAPLPLSVAGAAATYYNGKIYVIGGCTTYSCAPFRDTLQIYTIATDSWSSGAVLPQTDTFGSAVTIGNYIYLVCGTTQTAYRYDPLADQWDDAAMADPPELWGLAASAVLDGRFYLIGGAVGPNEEISNKTIAYDPVTDTWTYHELLNTATFRMQSGNLNGVLYVVGGFDQGYPNFHVVDRVEAYHQSCATATPVVPTSTATASPTPGCGVPPPWQPGPSLTPGRVYLPGALGPDGNYYVVGGLDPSYLWHGSVDRFDTLANAWATVAPLPQLVLLPAVGIADGKLLVAGGAVPGSPATFTNTLQIYDLSTHTWSVGAALPQTLAEGAGVTLGHKFYVIGGDHFTPPLYKSTYIYDIPTDTWSEGAELPGLYGRGGPVATTYNGRIYVFGGWGDQTLGTTDTLLVYDPDANTWTKLGSANIGGLGGYPGLSLYTPGVLLATAGGNSSYQPSTTTRLYNISSGTWSNGPALNSAHMGHAQGLLPDGRVLVAGGYGQPGYVVTGAVELLGPPPPCATSTATPPPPPPTATPTGTPSVSPTTPPIRTRTATPTATPCAFSFSDVQPTDYFYEPVRYLYCHGVISGYGDNTFRPYANTTRAQMVKIVVLGFGFSIQTPAGSAHTFTDVLPDNPFFAFVETAAARGIVGGYTTSPPCPAGQTPCFQPSANVTRGQLSKIDVVAANWPVISPASPTFTDVLPGSAFYSVVETAVCHGVISGYGDHTFRPGATATRGQISKIVYLSITAGGGCAPPTAAK